MSQASRAHSYLPEPAGINGLLKLFCAMRRAAVIVLGNFHFRFDIV
ncbi:hypothetical protein [Paraburkholderia sp. J7]|nr:hypothetical protein [Paraburkholderia sp. J7]